VKPRRGVHALVQVLFLDVGMAVEVDDADFLVRLAGNAAHGGKADGVIAAQDHRKGAGAEHVPDGVADLVEGFSMLAGMVNTSPASHSVICSRRSTPIS